MPGGALLEFGDRLLDRDQLVTALKRHHRVLSARGRGVLHVFKNTIEHVKHLPMKRATLLIG